jgi:hypothetical protein
MRFFVSYSRRDQARIEPLAKRLSQLGHETWMDDRLSGGQAWWDEILASIRSADAFLFAVSETSLESQACALERGYARSLGKPLLPVAVESVQPQLLPPDLAAVQFVDYSTPGEDAAIQLAGALSRVPAAPALPDPLPPPPPIPVSYLSDISEKILAPSLSLDEQRSLVASLEEGLRRSQSQKDPDDYEAGLDLLRKLEHRSDLYAETARRITDVMEHMSSAATTAPTASAPVHEPAVKAESEPAARAEPAPVDSPAVTGWGVNAREVAKPSPEPRSKTPRWMVGLAVVGGIFLLLIAIAVLGGGNAEPVCFFNEFGDVVCQ